MTGVPTSTDFFLGTKSGRANNKVANKFVLYKMFLAHIPQKRLELCGESLTSLCAVIYVLVQAVAQVSCTNWPPGASPLLEVADCSISLFDL